MFEMEIIHTTLDNVEIFVEKGSKSEHDFKIKYKEPGKRKRTPKHIHIIIDMYRKFDSMPELTLKLKDHFIYLFKKVIETNEFPPKLFFFNQSLAEFFSKLDKFGVYSTEFLLIVNELIFIQEKINYPKGDLTLRLYKDFGVKDCFTIINTATRRK